MELGSQTEEEEDTGGWHLPKLERKDHPAWARFYKRVEERTARELERGADGDGIMAAWNMAARECLGECNKKN